MRGSIQVMEIKYTEKKSRCCCLFILNCFVLDDRESTEGHMSIKAVLKGPIVFQLFMFNFHYEKNVTFLVSLQRMRSANKQ